MFEIRSSIIRKRRRTLIRTASTITISALMMLVVLPNYQFTQAGTPVWGIIDNDTTWDVSGSPYWVEGNLVVLPGATLTIVKGVEVKFDGKFSLFIEGTLNVSGESSAPVRFSSNKTTAAPGDWNGIQINSTGRAYLKSCIVEYGLSSISIQSSFGNLISNCDVRASLAYGIYILNSSNNTVENSRIYLTEIRSGYGIYVEKSTMNTIRGTEVYLTPNGLDFSLSSNNTIENSRIYLNNVGLTFRRYSHYNKIANSTIVSNRVGGIHVYFSENNTITNNTISNNGFGMDLFRAFNSTVTYNSFLGNIDGAIDESTSTVKDGRFNYFGTDDPRQIEKLIRFSKNFYEWLPFLDSGQFFVNDSAKWSGEILLDKGLIINGRLRIENASVLMNEALGKSYIQVNGHLEIFNSTFRSDNAYFAVLYVNKSSGYIINSNFIHQNGIGIETESGIEIAGSRFENGTYGIKSYMAKMSISQSRFENNFILSIGIWASPQTKVQDVFSNDPKGTSIYFSPQAQILNTISTGVSPPLPNSQGILVWESSNVLIKNSMISNKEIGIAVYNSTSLAIRDTSILGIAKENIYIAGSLGGSKVVTTNTTFDKTKIYFGDTLSTLTIGWLMDVKVVDLGDNPVPFANVNVRNRFGGSIFFGTTSTDGYVRKIPSVEYEQRDIDGDHDGFDWGEVTYHTPHNVSAWKGTAMGYAIPEPFMDQNRLVVVVINLTSPPSAPKLLYAYLSANMKDVTIVWNLSKDDGSGQRNVDHYSVYYSKSYDPRGNGYVFLGKVPAGTTSFTHYNAGLGDPNNYFYYVKANDTTGQGKWEGQASKFTRYLTKGWQLASIPLMTIDRRTEAVLQTLNYNIVRYYNASDSQDPWKAYMKFKTLNDLVTVDRTMALWINVTEDSYLTVAGIVPTSTSISLKAGWNFVGYPSFSTIYTATNLKSQTGAARIEGYDPNASPYYLKVLADNYVLKAGEGYWLKVSQDLIWLVLN